MGGTACTAHRTCGTPGRSARPCPGGLAHHRACAGGQEDGWGQVRTCKRQGKRPLNGLCASRGVLLRCMCVCCDICSSASRKPGVFMLDLWHIETGEPARTHTLAAGTWVCPHVCQSGASGCVPRVREGCGRKELAHQAHLYGCGRSDGGCARVWWNQEAQGVRVLVKPVEDKSGVWAQVRTGQM